MNNPMENANITTEHFRVLEEVLPFHSLQISEVMEFIDPISTEIYNEIEKLNERLPNIEKWAISNGRLTDYMMIYVRNKAGLPEYGEKYDPTKTYKIKCSLIDLRQIGFLRDYMELHYKPTPKVELCSVRKDPISVCPLEFRVITNYLKFTRYILNGAMKQFTANITSENVCLAMLISQKFTYQWEPQSYHSDPPAYFRFLATRLYKPEQDDIDLFRQLIVNRYMGVEMIL
jgi:hypothetical protein